MFMDIEQMLNELKSHNLWASYSTESNMFRGIWAETPIHGEGAIDIEEENELLGNIFYIMNVDEIWRSYVLAGQKTICIRSAQDFTLAAVSIKSYFTLAKRSNIALRDFSACLWGCINEGLRVEINSDQTIEFHRGMKEAEQVARIWLTDDLKWRSEQVNQEDHDIQGRTHESLRNAISILLSV